MGLPKRKVSHARQGDRRAHLALSVPTPRESPPLPRDEAVAPRLPELRLVRRSAGDRAQEEGRRGGLLTAVACGSAVPAAAVGPAPSAKSRVAVDAMGGDHAPEEVVPGALALRRGQPDDEVILVGDPARIRAIAGPPPA